MISIINYCPIALFYDLSLAISLMDLHGNEYIAETDCDTLDIKITLLRKYHRKAILNSILI